MRRRKCTTGATDADRHVARRQPRVYWTLLDPPHLDHELAARLSLADELLARWLVGELPYETGLEKLQTALEIMLRTVTGSGKGVRCRSSSSGRGSTRRSATC
jgi:hypothetical protein